MSGAPLYEQPSAASGGNHTAAGQAIERHRSPAETPLRKLTVDLIKTYRHINEVCYQLWAYFEVWAIELILAL